MPQTGTKRRKRRSRAHRGGNWFTDAVDWTKGAVNTVGNTVLPVLKSTKAISRIAKYVPGGAVSDAADLVGLGRQGGRAAAVPAQKKGLIRKVHDYVKKN